MAPPKKTKTISPPVPDPSAPQTIDETQVNNLFDPHVNAMLDANFKGITDAGVGGFLALQAASVSQMYQMLQQSNAMFAENMSAAREDRAALARIVETNLAERAVLFTRMVTEAQDHHSADLDHRRTVNANSATINNRTAQDGQTLSVTYLEPTETDENISSAVGAATQQAVTKGMQDIVPSINNTVKAAAAEAAQNTVGIVGLGGYGTADTMHRDSTIANDVHAITMAQAAMNQANNIADDMAEIKAMVAALQVGIAANAGNK